MEGAFHDVSSRRVDADRAGEMSFTVRVKENYCLCKRFESELAAIIKMSGSLGISMGGNDALGNNRKCQDHTISIIVASFL